MSLAAELKLVLHNQKVSVTDAAKTLGVDRVTLSRVLGGKAKISVSIALKFEKAYGINAVHVLHQQLNRDIAKARKEIQ